MSTIQISTSVEQLLDAVAQLPTDELSSLTEKIIALRANHLAQHIEQNEADLLLQINRDVSPEIRSRSNELIQKRQTETLNDAEYTELIALTAEFEQREVERVTALAELAKIRRVSITELMKSLGIEAPSYD